MAAHAGVGGDSPHVSVSITTADRRFGKSQMLVDFVLNAANSGEVVICLTPVPTHFEERLQARAVERGISVWSTREKYGMQYGVRVRNSRNA